MPAPVLQIEAAEAARQPQIPKAEEKRPKAAQSSSSDVQIIEETGITASSPMPAPSLSPAIKQEAPTQKSHAKPAVEPSRVRPRPEHVRMQPRRSCATGIANSAPGAAQGKPAQRKEPSVSIVRAGGKENSDAGAHADIQSPLPAPEPDHMPPAKAGKDSEGGGFADHPALAPPFAPKKEPGAPEGPGPSNPAQLKPAKVGRKKVTARRSTSGMLFASKLPKQAPKMTACKSTATTAAVGVAGLANAGGLASEAADVAHQAHGNAAGDEAAVPKKKEKAKAGVGAEAEGTHAYKPAVKKVEVKKEADVAEASHTQRPAGASAAAKPRKRKAADGEVAERQAKKKSGKGAGLIQRQLSPAELKAAVDALEKILPNKEYKYKPGEEPYRKLGIRVNEEPLNPPVACQLVRDTGNTFTRYYQEAMRAERERYDAAGGRHPDGKKMSKRPDVKARTRMTTEGKSIHQEKTAGHVAGHVLNQRYTLRAEMGVLGLHLPPVAGIAVAAGCDLPKDCPPFAVSVMSSGCYEDDTDTGETFVLTGAGGNNLLGNKRQQADQALTRENLAMVGNIQLGIPVRLIRKNVDKGSEQGNILIYDGLYNVVKYWEETGNSGFKVYKFECVRRPNQGELYSRALVFGGGQAPKHFTAETRKTQVRYLFSNDITNGKEAVPVVGVNDWDEDRLIIGECNTPAEELPLKLDEHGCPALQRYITKDERAPDVPEPAIPEVPKEYASNPHNYIKRLNWGRMPYELGNDERTVMLPATAAMVFECGPWTGCPDGVECMYALTQRPTPWRLEVFKTRGRGWGVRSWDTIPTGAYITGFRGLIRRRKANRDDDEDDTFIFDLDKRADMSWDNKFLDEPDSQDHVKYVVDGARIGSVGRYINHSCNPNCYVQPVLSTHLDRDMPAICFFAMRTIPPMEELAYDYGPEYIMNRLNERCHCGQAVCNYAGGPASPASS